VNWRRAVWSLDGRRLLVSNHLQSELLVFESDGLNPRRLSTGSHVSTVAISADGRWGAASFGRGGVVRVWNLDEEAATHDFPLRADAHPMAFSPDGKWLVINQDDDAYRFFHVGTWQPGPSVKHRHRSATGRPPAFSGDGRLLALVDGDTEVLLLDGATLEKLVTLRAPAARIISEFAFNAYSSLLAVACREYGTQVWDLAALRKLYASMGIDWDHPPIAPVKTPPPPVRRVEVLMNEQSPAASDAKKDSAHSAKTP
jgi:WD40 repeat protein